MLAVTWRVTHVRGRVRAIAVEQIVDPNAGPTPEEAAANPVRIELPPTYLAAARARVSAQTYLETEQSPFWTFTIYDPAQPARADISSARDCLQPPPAG